MSVQVPNFTNPMLNRVAQGDMSILAEEYDFTLTESMFFENWNALIVASTKGYLNSVNCLLEIDAVSASAVAENNKALRWAARNGHLEVVNRLLEIDAVRENAAAVDNEALRKAAKNGHIEVVHALAQAQWPLGRLDMPEGMHQYLPLIKAGAQLYTAKREQERILISALQNKSVLSTKSLYSALSLEFDFGANRLFTLPGNVVERMANYAGYERQYLAEQVRKDHWQNAWNDMRRSERMYGLFTDTNINMETRVVDIQRII